MSGFNFMDLAKAEFGRRVGQAAVTGQKIQSDRGPAKANPVQTSSAEKVSRKRAKAEKGRKKDKRSRERGARVAGAVGDFAGAVAAGLLAEGARRQKMGLSGGGFATAFAQGVQPIVDFGKIMRGKADPGTILGRVGMKAMQDNQRFSVGDAAIAAGQAAADDEPVDPLDLEPDELTSESIVMSDEEVAAAARAAVEAATAPKDPFEGVAPADRATFITLGMGSERLSDEQIAASMNDLTNKYGAAKAGELVRMIQEQGSVVYDEQGQAQDPFSMFAVTDDLPQGEE